MKKAVAVVMAVWGTLWFIVTTLLQVIMIIPVIFMKEPASTKWFHKTSKIWMHLFLYGVGCPVKVSGKENFRKNENYIAVCNHNSFFDIFAVTPFLPHANKSIAKASLAKIPIFNWVYRQGTVLVDRESASSKTNSFAAMKHVLQDLQLDMIVYPEGTRNKTNKPLKEFYNGAFRLAVDTQKNIIPVVIFNTRRILPSHKFALEPHKIFVVALPEVAVANKTHKQLKEEVFGLMWEFYAANEKKYKN